MATHRAFLAANVGSVLLPAPILTIPDVVPRMTVDSVLNITAVDSNPASTTALSAAALRLQLVAVHRAVDVCPALAGMGATLQLLRPIVALGDGTDEAAACVRAMAATHTYDCLRRVAHMHICVPLELAPYVIVPP